MLNWIQSAYCGLHGHEHIKTFGRGRMYLRCVACGHETQGWTLAATPPTPRFRGDARRLASIAVLENHRRAA